MKRPVALTTLIALVLLTGGSLWWLSEPGGASSRPAGVSSVLQVTPEGLSEELPSESAPEAESGSLPVSPAEALETEELEQESPEPQRPQPASPQPPAAARGPAATTGVLHLIADHTWTTPQGEQRPPLQTEVWLDLETGDAFLKERDPSGNFEVIFVRRGLSQTRLAPLDRRSHTNVAPDEHAPFLHEIRNRVLGYRLALEEGTLQIVGEEVISGQPAIQVRARGAGPTDMVDIFLSREHRLLVKEVNYRPGATGGREAVQTYLVTYPLVETLNRNQVPSEVFSPSIPADWEQVTTRTLDLASAGAFRLFDLYWLGPEYGGMSLGRIFHDEVVRSDSRLNVVMVEYVQPVAEGQPPASPSPPNQLSLFQRAPLTSEELAARGRGSSPQGESVTVRGRRATLFVPQSVVGQEGGPAEQGRPAGQTPPTFLELPLDRGLVVIYGKDRAQVLQAAQDLQKVN